MKTLGHMNARRWIFLITGIAAVLTMATSAAMAGTSTRTFFSNTGGYQGRISSYIDVCAEVGSACADEGTVRVKLLKLKDGSWVKVAVEQAEWVGPWHVEFTGAPRRGQCKLIAVYSGSEQWDPSRGSIKGRCNDADWQA